MTTRFATLITIVALAAGLSAQHDDKTVAGAWNMSLQGDHVIPVGLELKQDGTKVTGTILMPTQNVGQRVEVSLSGEFADGALKVSGAVEHAKEPTTIEITAKMADDGTLEGKLSMPQHSLPFTAERLKQRK